MLPEQQKKISDSISLLRLMLDPSKSGAIDTIFQTTHGKNGTTPVKGKDYLTPPEVDQIIQEVVRRVLPLVTPVKGVHYTDGIHGKNGINGKTPKRGRDYFTAGDVAEFLQLATPIKGKHYFDGKDGKSVNAKDVIEELKKLKGKDRLSIKHIQDTEFLAGRLMRGGQGSWKSETPSGTINGVNKVFTLVNAPASNSLHLYLNGAFQTDGGVDYTLSDKTITFVVAPVVNSVLSARYM